MAEPKYKNGDKVYVLYDAAPGGLIEGIVHHYMTDLSNTTYTKEYYTITMLNYYVNGIHNEYHTNNAEFLSIEEAKLNCTEGYLIPYGAAGPVLYGKKVRF